MPLNTGEFEFAGEKQVITRTEVLQPTSLTTTLPQSNMLQVLSNTSHYCVVPIGSRPSRWELFKKYTSRYELATGVKQLQVKSSLATKDRGVDMPLSFSVEWSVHDPVLVVQDDIRDISHLILRLIADDFRREARRWRDDQGDEAADAFRDLTQTSLLHAAFVLRAYNFSVQLEAERKTILKEHQKDRLSIEVTSGQGLMHMIQRVIAKNPDNILEVLKQLRDDQISSIKDSNEIMDLLRERGWSDKKIDDAFQDSVAITPGVLSAPEPKQTTSSGAWWQQPGSGPAPKVIDTTSGRSVSPVEPELDPDDDD